MMLERGFTSREIAAKIGCKSHTTILNEQNERTIIRRLMTSKCSTAVQLKNSLQANEKIKVCTETICRALRRNGLKTRVKCKKPLLSKKYREQHLKFAKRFKDWTVSDWSKVVWSDESKFQIFGSDRHQYCWKKDGFLCKIEGGLDVELYRKILEEDFIETLRYYKLSVGDIIFQQDNDLKHTTTLTKKWFEDNGIEVLPWPPQLPDLNPIEHLWNDIDCQIRALNVEIKGKDALWEYVSKIWNETLLETCTKLIETIPERIQDVINAKGGYTQW
ncbi:IS630 family transposase [Rhizophagus clarus]|uniref:IS630 family transposase n=1 Tax=Rhizophagus clarus TaxID=94130 RepID=A0A8H3QMX7_9GLOM|nr:IS630 family transposase [Rhizophagus clarus]